LYHSLFGQVKRTFINEADQCDQRMTNNVR